MGLKKAFYTWRNHLLYTLIRGELSFEIRGVFAGKRVALVGPADTAVGRGKGASIDGYDVVTRVNRGVYLIQKPEGQNDLGTRTDVLFHNLTDRHGDYDIEFHGRNQVGKVIAYERGGSWRRGNINIRRFYDNHPAYAREHLHIVGADDYEAIVDFLGGTKPTAGFMAIWTILHSDCKELFITGFSFFQSEYVAGYYATNVTVAEQLKRFDAQKGHSPVSEADAFKRLAERFRDRLTLDPFLEELVDGKVSS